MTHSSLAMLLLSSSYSTFATASLDKRVQLTQFTAAKIQLAQQLQQQEKLPEAIHLLTALTPRQAYDQAVVQRILGIFYWQHENSVQAINSLALAVKSNLLDESQARTTRRMLADILLSNQQYTEALPHYYHLLEQPTTDNGQIWLRIAQAHYQLQQWHKVISAVQQFEASNVTGDKVQPLNLLLSAQSQLQLWSHAAATLQRMLVIQPANLLWWRQLAGIQLRLNQPQSALDSLLLADRQGLALSLAERKTLAQLYAQQGIPEKAALQLNTVLSEINNKQARQKILVTQARYWQQAKEWQLAIQVWRQVAQTTAQYRWQLAQLLLQQGNYQSALHELNQVDIQQGKNKVEIAQIELAKVRAYYKLRELEKAFMHAKQANNLSPSASAKGWIVYLKKLRRISAS